APGGAPPGGGGPAVGAPGGGGWAGFPASPAVEYKFVDTKSDRKAFEAAITQHGKDGWEFCGSERFAQGELVLVFKKKKGSDWGGGLGMPGVPGVPGVPGGGRWGGVIEVENAAFDTLTLKLKNADAAALAELLRKQLGQKGLLVATALPGGSLFVVGTPDAIKGARKVIEENDTKPKGTGPVPIQPLPPFPPLPPGPGGGTAPPAPKPPAGNLTIFELRNAAAEDIATVLKKVFPAAEVTAVPRSNQLIVRADGATLTELKALLDKLDVALPAPPQPK
ncbi:MAG: hypothetical protein FJ304_26620, partial [Planctomycetes bacterium]|nr:hypothetical protein [Planctomycetota bacterium]